LVNPHDIDGMAQKISLALSMRVEERRERWLAMIDKLKSASVQTWFSDFVRALGEVRRAAPPVAARSNAPVPFGRAERNIAQTR
jgi:trehalose 6-phosphate synthase